ncbi:MAG: hypothetical protein O3C07_06075, partial [Bacteroidetes bacterium]|nr:hypothetical protein [Bacteroidota bacterium]
TIGAGILGDTGTIRSALVIRYTAELLLVITDLITLILHDFIAITPEGTAMNEQHTELLLMLLIEEDQIKTFCAVAAQLIEIPLSTGNR